MKSLLTLSLLLAPCSHLSASQKPNVIVIMADALGYGDVSSYGATVFQTPSIDRLANKGHRFTSGSPPPTTASPKSSSKTTASST
jgi:arylsulfatase A